VPLCHSCWTTKDIGSFQSQYLCSHARTLSGHIFKNSLDNRKDFSTCYDSCRTVKTISNRAQSETKACDLPKHILAGLSCFPFPYYQCASTTFESLTSVCTSRGAQPRVHVQWPASRLSKSRSIISRRDPVVTVAFQGAAL
jgi:hypothetical protein